MPLRPIDASSVQVDFDLSTRLEPLVIARHDNETVGPCHRGEHAGATGSERFDFSIPHKQHPDEVGPVECRGEFAPQVSPNAPVGSLFPLTEQELQSGTDKYVEADHSRDRIAWQEHRQCFSQPAKS
jgi:hypothetical protein